MFNTDKILSQQKLIICYKYFVTHFYKGPYVLVLLASGLNQAIDQIPVNWLVSFYSNLSRCFKKNVQYVVLVKPSPLVRYLYPVIKPFFKAKSTKKVKFVSVIYV